MHRQRPLNEPVQFNSPQEDLREISMFQDQNNRNIDNFKTQPKQIKTYGMLDGWVKFEYFNEKQNRQVVLNRSKIYENFSSHKKIQDCQNSFFSSRSVQSRKNIYDKNIQQKRPMSNQQTIRKTKSQDFAQTQSSFLQQNLPCIANSINLLQNNLIGNKSVPQSKIIHGWSLNPRKVIVQAVNYPILQISVNPQKRLVPNIGRIRHMLNLKNKHKH